MYIYIEREREREREREKGEEVFHICSARASIQKDQNAMADWTHVLSSAQTSRSGAIRKDQKASVLRPDAQTCCLRATRNDEGGPSWLWSSHGSCFTERTPFL